MLSVALVFLVLAGEFASFTIPLVVMVTVPLAAAGGFILLWLTGQTINAVSLIGIVVMIGMADNEAVVKLAPDDSAALNNLANVLLRLKDPGAMKIAEQAVEWISPLSLSLRCA